VLLCRPLQFVNNISLNEPTVCVGEFSSTNQGASIMAMKIPSDAKVITDNRLSLIRIVAILADRLVGKKGGLKDQVKATMQDKKATYAQSELAIAQLVPGNDQGPIDANKAFALTKIPKDKGGITLKEFLDCCTVGKEAFGVFVSAEKMAKMCKKIPDPTPSLRVEFKEGIDIDPEKVGELLVEAVAAMAEQRQKALAEA
jgi:hypothetical protein